MSEISGIVNIFLVFIHEFEKSIDDEERLVEIVKGLHLLARMNKQDVIKIVSGIDHPQGSGALISIMCEMLSRKNEALYSGAVKYIGSILVSED